MSAAPAQAAVVTGASQGIGREIALRLGRDGWEVVLAARDRERLERVRGEIEGAGGRARVVPTDVTDREQTARLAEAAEAGGPPVGLLVANSGIAGPVGELWRCDAEEWERTIAVNLIGVFLVCHALLPGMVARRSGSVVVIGSATGKRPMAGRTPYAASKLALVGLVRTLALETGPYGVRVNLVSPGPVEGERLERVIAAQAEARGRDPEEQRRALEAAAPLRRFTSPADVAAAVAFLASDEAKAITGEDLNVSSGWVMH